MKAVLVGTIGDDKLYYVIDAARGDDDGALERENGSVLMLDFFPYVAMSRGLRKIRSSRFHRKLWDAPSNIASGTWYETFIGKSREIDEASLEGQPVYSALGKDRKKINKVNEKAKKFKTKSLADEILVKSADAAMVKFDRQVYAYKTAEKRREAWVAMCLLRQLEENDNA